MVRSAVGDEKEQKMKYSLQNKRGYYHAVISYIYVDHAFAGNINFFLDFHINFAAYEQLFICIS